MSILVFVVLFNIELTKKKFFAGKKTKRAKGITLQAFMSEGKPINSSQVTKTVVTSWADAVEEEECRPPQTFSLPTAPRASRVFDYVPENSPYTAYLSKLPYDANREDIEEFFSELHITDIKLPREDDNSTKNRGFAYVEFAERSDLIAAISIPDPTMMNRRFKIDLPNEEQGKRTGGRGRYDNFGSNVDENSTNWRKDTREDNDGGGLGRRGGGGGYGYSNRDRDRQNRDPSPETGNWRDKQRPRSDSPPPQDRFQKGKCTLSLRRVTPTKSLMQLQDEVVIIRTANVIIMSSVAVTEAVMVVVMEVVMVVVMVAVMEVVMEAGMVGVMEVVMAIDIPDEIIPAMAMKIEVIEKPPPKRLLENGRN